MEYVKTLVFASTVMVLAFLSCKTEAEELGSIPVNPSMASPFSTKELFESVYYIKLSPNGAKGHIREISKLLYDGSSMYVLQKERLSPSVYRFDNSGQLLYHITSHLEGPESLIGANDMVLNEEREAIDIMDSYQSKIVSIRQSDGEFISETKIPHTFTQFIRLGPDQYAFYAGNTPSDLGLYNLFVFPDVAGEPMRYDSIRPYLAGTTMADRCFSSFPNNATYLYRDEFSSVIWRVNSLGASRAYKVDFGNNWFSESALQSFNNISSEERLQIMNSLLKTDKVSSIKLLEEFGDYIFFYYRLSGKSYYNLYNKQEDLLTSYYIDYTAKASPNDLDGGPMPNKLLGRFNEYLIFEVQSELVYRLGQIAEEGSDFKRFAQTVQEEDNPILMLAKLREKYR